MPDFSSIIKTKKKKIDAVIELELQKKKLEGMEIMLQEMNKQTILLMHIEAYVQSIKNSLDEKNN